VKVGSLLHSSTVSHETSGEFLAVYTMETRGTRKWGRGDIQLLPPR
jgi:hypothetical protein